MSNKKMEDEEDIRKKLDEILRKINEMDKTIKQKNEIKDSVLSGSLKNIFECTQKFYDEKKIPPTVKDISEMTSLAGPTVSGYLNTLAQGGYLDRITELKDVGDSRRVRMNRFKPIKNVQ